MTPIASSCLSKPDELSFFLERSPKDLLQYRSVPKALNEKIIASACSQLSQLKTYSAEFTLIEKAIEQIPQDLSGLNIIDAIRAFNDTIAGYKQVIAPFPQVSCLAEVQALEQQLENHSLQQLWDALPSSVFKPQLEAIEQKRAWFEDAQNRALLEKVIVLNLRGKNIVRLPREIFTLSKLEVLDLSQNLLEVLPGSIKIWKNLIKLDLFDNKLKCMPPEIKYLKSIEELRTCHNCTQRRGLFLKRSSIDISNVKRLFSNLKKRSLKSKKN